MEGKRKSAKTTKPGETVGKIEVLECLSKKREKPKIYKWRCTQCGNVVTSTMQIINRYSDTGCSVCRKKKRDEAKLEESRKYIKERFGQLVIEDVFMGKERLYNAIFAKCKCDCGKTKDILLKRILWGGAKSCGHGTDGALKSGHELLFDASKTGTMVTAIDGRRKVNKNSSTGITGVCYNKKIGNYRAYINFRRKQYNLGCFEDINDAKRARENAEKEIYGNFLEWYKKEYPDLWEKINKTREE